jgi:hypothetical protein
MSAVPATSRATLNITSASLDSEAITDRLGIQPSQVIEPGTGQTETTWSLEARADESQPLGDHLTDLLEEVDGRRTALDALISDGCQVELFCYLEGKPLGNLVTLDP